MLISRENSALVFIDVQERLFQVISDKEPLLLNLRRLAQAAKVLKWPFLITEQYPKGLGPTLTGLKEEFGGALPIQKVSFSSFGEENFVKELKRLNAKTLVLCGIECHVCVHQTALDALSRGYQVQVVADAVSSRTEENRKVGLDKMRQAGVVITSTETVIFEILKRAGTDEFKEILKIVK